MKNASSLEEKIDLQYKLKLLNGFIKEKEPQSGELSIEKELYELNNLKKSIENKMKEL